MNSDRQAYQSLGRGPGSPLASPGRFLGNPDFSEDEPNNEEDFDEDDVDEIQHKNPYSLKHANTFLQMERQEEPLLGERPQVGINRAVS